MEPFSGSLGYKGKFFLTIKSLREFINKTENKLYSETHFRRDFIAKHGKHNHKIQFLKKRPQCDLFLINKTVYYGWREVVEAGLAKTKRQVYYRLSSSKWLNYQYKTQTKNRNFKLLQKQYKLLTINSFLQFKKLWMLN